MQRHIDKLKKYIRPAGAPAHPLLIDGGIRPVDFLLSDDGKWVLPSNDHGLSFATSMKKLRSVFSLKARRFAEVDIYAIDDLLRFYAAELADQRTVDVVSHMKIASEAEARHVLEFCERMFDLSMRFEKEGRIAPGGPVKVYDVEKLHSLLNDFVSEQGFDHLIADQMIDATPFTAT